MSHLVVLANGDHLQLVVDEGVPPVKDVGVILMHGASGDHSSGHLSDTAHAFAESGHTTVRFSLKTSLAKRADACRAVLEFARRTFCKRWVLAGHSMGARVASEVAHSDREVLACVFFSYPLHPPGKQDKLRDTPLTSLQQPLLFVRGTRDAFSDAAEFEAVRARLTSQRVEDKRATLRQVHTVDEGDHSLKALGGKDAAAAALSDAREAAVRFAHEVAGSGPGGSARTPAAETGSAAREMPEAGAGGRADAVPLHGDGRKSAAGARAKRGRAAARSSAGGVGAEPLKRGAAGRRKRGPGEAEGAEGGADAGSGSPASRKKGRAIQKGLAGEKRKGRSGTGRGAPLASGKRVRPTEKGSAEAKPGGGADAGTEAAAGRKRGRAAGKSSAGDERKRGANAAGSGAPVAKSRGRAARKSAAAEGQKSRPGASSDGPASRKRGRAAEKRAAGDAQEKEHGGAAGDGVAGEKQEIKPLGVDRKGRGRTRR